MGKFTVSVCLATYNGAQFIKDQIESLISQTQLPDEIIVSDDNSTDETPIILKQFQSQYPHLFRFFLHNNRIGFIRNFERCLKEARGDIVALCDQDDVWLPDKLAKQVAVFNEHPEVGLVFCDLRVVDSTLQPIQDSFWKVLGFKGSGLLPKEFNLRLLRRNVVTGSTLVIRREILKRAFPFPNSLPHDHWLAILGATLWRAFAIPDTLVLYRQHKSNAIGALIVPPAKIDDYIWNLEVQLQALEELQPRLENVESPNSQISACVSHIKVLRNFLDLRINLFSEKQLSQRKLIFHNLFRCRPDLLGQYSNMSMVFDCLAVISPTLAFLGLKNFQNLRKAYLKLISLKNAFSSSFHSI